MQNIFFKIKNRLNVLIKDFINDIKNYNISLALVKFITNLPAKGKFLNRLKNWSINKKHSIIIKYLENRYKDVLNKYKYEDDTCIKSEKKYIWICWLQGENNAPTIVKNCISSIRKNAKDYEVILITLHNYHEYINIPDYIIRKYKKGTLGSAHFSDIIRMMLLRDYGGLWLDSTIYCKSKIPKDIFNYSMYSCKSHKQETHYISGFQWTSFLLGGMKNSVFYRYMVDFYLDYWSKENTAIDYLLIDYIILLGYRNIDSIKQILDKVPINNLDRDELAFLFNKEFDEETYKEFMSNDTCFFKLSWREAFKSYTVENKKTFYNVFLNKYHQYFDMG